MPVKDKELKNLEKLLTEDPSSFELLTKNLIQKSEAFDTNNNDFLNNILDEEETMLSNIDNVN